jgi:hypothetical protein
MGRQGLAKKRDDQVRLQSDEMSQRGSQYANGGNRSHPKIHTGPSTAIELLLLHSLLSVLSSCKKPMKLASRSEHPSHNTRSRIRSMQ